MAYNLVDLEDMPHDMQGLLDSLIGIDGVLSARFILGDSDEGQPNDPYKLKRDASLL